MQKAARPADTSATTLKTELPSQALPPGLNNAFIFAVFNALSFQIVLSTPMVLYAKSLGASATVLGLLAGLMPLLVIFQIPAAQYVDRVGYKKFVYAGWGTRVLFIFFIATVPLTGGFLNDATRIALILALMFAFSLSRGISSAAWLPWITSLVPPGRRGRYLSVDAACTNVGSFFAFLIGALCLGRAPMPWQFALLFLFSGVMGATSLVFLNRVPDVATPSQVRVSSQSVPWAEMVRFVPFRKLMRLSLVWSVAYGGMTTFTVAYLKVNAGMPENKILMVTAAAFLGGLCSLWFLGSRLDALGSKPVLSFSFVVWLAIAAGWVALAGGALPAGLGVLLVLEFLMGLFAALISMSNVRLAMAIVPVMGRNHFFALFTVVGSVTLGVAPVAWGLLIDAVGARNPVALGLQWNRYTVFFACTAVVMFVGLLLARRLDEPEAASMEGLLREVLIQSPQRIWVRLWPRG